MKKFTLVCGGRKEILLRDDAPYRGKRIGESKKDAQKLKKFVIDVQRDADKWLYEKDFGPTDGSYDGDTW